MKRILIILIVLSELTSYGQAKIDMSPVFLFTPANATSPASTVSYTTPVNFSVYIKNTGNTVFSGSVLLTAVRDTTGGIGLDSATVFATLQPNGLDSASVVMSFTPSAGSTAFKSGGNGNTIVVWPLIISGNGIDGDSVRPIIWVNDVNSVFEFEKTHLKVYPNPVIHDLTIKAQPNKQYKNIIIYDVFARKVKELSFKETIDVSELNAGSYWMIINSEDKSYRVNFVKE
jgi:hypothetical protein